MAKIAAKITEEHWVDWEKRFGPLREYLKELGIDWEDVVAARVESSSASVSIAVTVQTYREINGVGVKGKFAFDYTPPL